MLCATGRRKTGNTFILKFRVKEIINIIAENKGKQNSSEDGEIVN